MFFWTIAAMIVTSLIATGLTVRIMMISFGKPPTRGKKGPSINAYTVDDTETIQTESEHDNEIKGKRNQTELVERNQTTAG